ncbi:MAG: TonB-dependent receptor plug domain-containing protein [Janthinobacterium lividum]
MIVRSFLVAATSVLALSAAAQAAAQAVPAQPGQTASTQAGPDNEQGAAGPAQERDDIVVTGTRTAGRSRLDSASPVDVLSATTLRQQGTTELAAALQAVAPSIDFPRASATDGTDAIRPVTLRGLSPDETLVLVNGLRAHPSALLNINGSVGRGAAAVDLNTIPTVALDRIEVLRDGASAQYGSDAIAGVVNIRLREARSGGGAQVNYGFYNTDIDTARGSRSTTGEHTVTVSGWQGVSLGDDGFLTLSGEYLHRDPTNRADFDPRTTPLQVTGRFGDPQVEQYSLWANAGKGIGGDWRVYGWFGYTDRDTHSAAFPRLASATTTLAGFPSGFLPIINTNSRDINSALGVKGTLSGWNIDLSVSYGRNTIDFATQNSANYAYGSATPHDFYDGKLTYDQLVGDLNVSRKFDVFQSLNVAFGVEGRRESFAIGAGDLASYDYPATGAVLTQSPGAQGFGGFSPANVVDRNRGNGSIYLDVEAQVTDKLLVGLAGRGEDYSDFGATGTGKASIRYDFTRWFALRGAVSTGFRAPALQQQYFTSIASVIQNGAPILTGTFPSTSPIAGALGGVPLQPERSTNFSAGTVIRAGGIDLTVDGYLIKLRDQLGLSENIQASTSPQVAALLAPYGVSAARFFINGLASTTKGIDAVAHYRAHTGGAGTFDLTLAGNVNHVDVTRVPTSTSALNPAPVLFARSRILTLEQGTPGEKLTGSVDWSLQQLGATARVTYYGNVNQPGTTPAADIFTGRHAITDLEFRYSVPKGPNFGVGVSNLFDVYPDRTIPANNTTGVVGFPYYSPFGFNGRYLYARAGVNW